jgi:hypothetical protein
MSPYPTAFRMLPSPPETALTMRMTIKDIIKTLQAHRPSAAPLYVMVIDNSVCDSILCYFLYTELKHNNARLI